MSTIIIERVEQNHPLLIDINFKNESLLSRALTHRSYINEHPDAIEDNERLEFLGDAILDFLVGAWLYHHFPEMKEGELTRLRSALVKTEQLAQFAQQYRLGSLLMLGKGEEDSGGRRRPALLCATFEAVIGAYYLDSGINTVQTFVEPLLQNAVEVIIRERGEQDPKSLFQEWIQSQGYGPPSYRVVSTSGPEHDKNFIVEVWVGDTLYGRGEGSSKRLATKSAAQAAIKTLGLDI